MSLEKQILSLLLVLLKLWTTYGRVGFEIEFPSILVRNTTSPLFPKAVLYQAKSGWWNLTVDKVIDNYDYLEVVTVPFDYNSKDLSLDTLSQALSQVQSMAQRIEAESINALETSQEEPQFPLFYCVRNSDLTAHVHANGLPFRYRLFPQVTFGISPSHLYSLVCSRAFENPELKFFLSQKGQIIMGTVCGKMNEFFDSSLYLNVTLSDNPSLKSFLLLFGEYIMKKETHCLPFPKKIAGIFLARTSFSEMFYSLEKPIQDALLENKLLLAVAHHLRGSDIHVSKERVFYSGYYQNQQIHYGPTIEEWIQAFTRENNPQDLLSLLDFDHSMGGLPLDYLQVEGEGKKSPQWIIENRGMPELQVSQFARVLEKLFVYLSTFAHH